MKLDIDVKGVKREKNLEGKIVRGCKKLSIA